jgi:hypothetical protein
MTPIPTLPRMPILKRHQPNAYEDCVGADLRWEGSKAVPHQTAVQMDECTLSVAFDREHGLSELDALRTRGSEASLP